MRKNDEELRKEYNDLLASMTYLSIDDFIDKRLPCYEEWKKQKKIEEELKEGMTEYIDKSSLYKKVSKLEELARDRYLDTPCGSPAYERYQAQMNERTALKHLIADFPSVDAVEVVRCKDCVHYEKGKDYQPYCNCLDGGTTDYPQDNDFCSAGERRKEK